MGSTVSPTRVGLADGALDGNALGDEDGALDGDALGDLDGGFEGRTLGSHLTSCSSVFSECSSDHRNNVPL